MTAQSLNITSQNEDFSSAQIEAGLLNFLESLSHQHCSNATIRNYRSDIRQFYKHAQLDELKEIFNKNVLKDFILAQKKKGLKDSSVTRKIASITQFALWSKKQGIISHDVNWLTSTTIESLLKKSLFTPPQVKATDNKVSNIEASKVTQIKKSSAFLKLFGNNKTQIKKEKTLTTEPKKIIEEEEKKGVLDLFSTPTKHKTKKVSKSAGNFILPYLNLGLIVLFFVGLGFLGYNQLVTETPDTLAYPGSPVSASRVLSFQGRLTDTAQNPITTATNMEFKIWDQLSGGTEGTCDGTNDCEYKTSTCSVTPDQDGIFNVGIGDDCGSEINQEVFSENAALWLEVIIASETLTPRQPIRTVPFAINSETVQGYPISASESASVNTLLVMDSGGYVTLAEDSPTLYSDFGTFTISASTLSLSSTGDLLFSDDNATNIPLTVIDSVIDSNLGQGIIDAINDVYDLTTGQDFFDQTDNIIYPAEYWTDEFAIGGNSTASADIWFGVTGSSVFNEQGNDADFRVEGDTELNLFLVDGGDNSVGIGAGPSSTQKLYVFDGRATDSNYTGIEGIFRQTSAAGATQTGMRMVSQFTGTTGTQSGLTGINSQVLVNGSGGTVTLGQGYTTSAEISLGATLTELRSINISNPVNSGTLTTNYGIYAEDQTNGTSNYGIYTNLGDVSLGDNLIIRNDSDRLQIGVGQDLELYHDGANSIITNGTGDLQINGFATSEVVFNESGSDVDFRIEGSGEANALFVQGSNGFIGVGDNTPASLFTIGNGDLFQINSSGSIIAIDNVAHTITDTTGDLELTSNSTNISLNDNVTFAGTTTLNSVAYTWPGADGSSGQVLSTDAGGGLSWASALTDSPSVGAWSHSDHFVYADDYWADDLIIGGNSTASADIQLYSDGGAVFNEQGSDADFRVEGDTNANLLFVDASTDKVGIGGDTTPDSLFSVGSSSQFQIDSTGSIVAIDGQAHSIADTTGDLTLDSFGGQIVFADTDVFNIGGILGVNYNAISDSGTATLASTDDDLYIEGILEVDSNLNLAASTYLNWGNTDGTSGYGFRDNSGTIQYKASGGAWADVGSGGGGGDSLWTLTSGSISPTHIFADTNFGNAATASARVSIAGSATRGLSALIINQTEDQDIFTASVSGLTVTKIDNSGYIHAPRFVDIANDSYYFDGASTGTSLAVAGEILTNAGTFESGVADGGSAVGYVFDTTDTLSTAGALIADFRNAGTSLLTIDKDGNLWAKGNIYSDKGFGVSMKNIGVALSQYDLVAINTTEDNSDGVPRMSATDSAFAKVGFGVVQETCTNGSTCKVVFQGETIVNVSNETNRGDYLFSSSTLGQAAAHVKQYDGMIGIATSTDLVSTYQVEMIFLHQPGVSKLRVADKNRMHADYREAAIDYTYANETNYYDIDENVRKGLYFDTFQDKIKVDSTNSDSLVDDIKQRAGLFGGVTMNATNTDTAGNTYLGAADANDVYYYDRTGGSLNTTSRTNAGVSSSGVKESEPQVLVELGIDPNWYNGVTIDASTSGTVAINPPANLNTTYNGSLIKASGRYTASEEDGPIIITIKSDNEATDSANPSITFDWATSYDLATAEHSGSDITTTKGANYTLETGTTDITVKFSQANYHAGDKFKIASWYLEPITANDRGDKQEFPERSNIIGGGGGVNIIDADTNKLWMRFVGSAPTWDTTNMLPTTPLGIHALNGKLAIGGASNGLSLISFASDTSIQHTSNVNVGGHYRSSIFDRNSGLGHTPDLTTNQFIVDNSVNDVHSAVICTGNSSDGNDDRAGRCITPKTYTAVATSGGVTVINEADQSAIDLLIDAQVGGHDFEYYNINLTTSGSLYISVGSTTTPAGNQFLSTYNNSIHNITADEGSWAASRNAYYLVMGPGSFGVGTTILGTSNSSTLDNLFVTENTSTINSDYNTIYIGTAGGLTILQEKQSDEANGSVKYYTKDYISEEMIGDIEGMWPLNGTGSIANSATMSDASLNARTLTADNSNGTGLAYTTGVRGTAINFDGTDDHITGSNPGVSTNFTIGLWVKPDTDWGQTGDGIFDTRPAAVGALRIYGSGSGSLHFSIGGGISSEVSIGDWTNQWHYVTLVLSDSNTITSYIDGIYTGSNSGGASGSSTTIEFGAYNNSNFFDGTIDEPFISNSALTAPQIKRMYETGRRALEDSHGINDFKNNLDEDGTGNGAYNNVSAVGVQMSSTAGYGPYAYVAMEDGDGDNDGWINKIDLGSDTVVQSFTTTTDPSIPDNDATSIAVSNAGLELVGMDGIGAIVPGMNSSMNNTTGTYYSDTIAIPDNISSSYAWINEYIDNDCSTCSITVSASNDGGTTYTQGTITNTDTNQSLPEKEYLFSFSTPGNSLKFKVDFVRDSSKDANVYIEKYGIAWFNDDDVAGGSNGGIFTNSGTTVADGSYIDVVHNQNTNDLLTQGWTYDTLDSRWESTNESSSLDTGDGTDGALSLTASLNMNTTDSSADSDDNGTFADMIAYKIDAATASGTVVGTIETDAPNGLVAGDEVLLINLQGGDGDFADVGNYEFLTIDSISNNDITFTSTILNSYDGTTPADQKVVIQRVPQYTSVTLTSSGSITASAWDALSTTPTGAAGYLTGIVAFKATSTVDIGAGTSITADSLGYRGGNGASDGQGGRNGESYDGVVGQGGNQPTGVGTYGGGSADGTATIGSAGVRGGGGGGGADTGGANDGSGGAGGGSYGGGGGGGGAGADCDATGGNGGAGGDTDVSGGGGGGGNAGCGTSFDGGDAGSAGSGGGGGAAGSGSTTAQGGGGNGSTAGEGGAGGGGGLYGNSDLSTIFYGSAGGEGGDSTNGGNGVDGGNGGGMVLIHANIITVNSTGTISADGATGSAASANSGAGGAGAGGSVFLSAQTATLSSNRITSNGGSTSASSSTAGGSGAGGVGRIRVEYILDSIGTTSPTASSANISSSNSFQIVQIDSNTTRLYNYSGSTQELRLDVSTGGAGDTIGSVSLAPPSADVDAKSSTNSIWINKTDESGTLLKLQNDGVDRFAIDYGGNATLSGSLKLNSQLQLGRFASDPTAMGDGALYYNSTDNKIYFHNGSTWGELGSGGGATGLWDVLNGSISPGNLTYDVLIGSEATSSANIALSREGWGLFNGARIGQALLQLNETGDQDILTASVSGLTVIKIDNSGYVHAPRFVDIANDSYFLDPASTDISLTTIGKVGLGTITPDSLLKVSGAITGKALTIFDETGDQDIFTASASGTTRLILNNSGDLTPGTDDSQDLGSSLLRWQDLYLGPSSLHIGTDGDEGILGYNITSNQFELNQTASISGNLAVGLRLEADAGTCSASLEGQMFYDKGTSTYKYCNATSWASFSSGGGGGGGGLFSNNGTSVADGSYVEVAHNQGTFDLLNSGWVYDTTTSEWKDISTRITSNNFGDGTDGALSLTASLDMNTTDSSADSDDNGTFADGIAYKIDAATASGTVVGTIETDAPNGLVAGDEILLINLQGATGDTADVGNYEFLTIGSISNNDITFTTTIVNSYDGSTPADQKVVIQRVPQYTDVILTSSGSITASAWDGLTTTPTGAAGYLTGIVAFRASGTVDIDSGTNITTDNLGFRNGVSDSLGPEGNAGRETTGGNDGSDSFGSASGGAGGTGNAGNGGAGGDGTGVDAGGGGGGSPYESLLNNSSSSLSNIQLGGGSAAGAGGGAGGAGGGFDGLKGYKSGNAGEQSRSAPTSHGTDGSNGSVGGGIIYIFGHTINVSGSISSDGGAGGAGGAGGNSQYNSGGGGGGGGGNGAGGGSIYLYGNTSNISNSLITANAGAGGTGGTGGTAAGAGANGTDGTDGATGDTGKMIIEDLNSSDFLITQVDNNTTRLYNYSGAAQDLRLSVSTGGSTAVSLAPSSADTDADASTNSIWINKTDESGTLLKLQNDATDRFSVGWDGHATLSGSLTIGAASLKLFDSGTYSTIQSTSGSLKLQAGGTTSGLAGNSSIEFLDSTGGVTGRFDTANTTFDTGDGTDGALSLTASLNMNTTDSSADSDDNGSFADMIAYKIDAATASGTTVGTIETDAPNGLVAGDEVLLINLQGAAGDTADVGNYEFLTIDSISNNDITFTSTIVNSYDGTTPSNQKVVIQRVPQYTSVTLTSSGSITASAWDSLATTPTGAAGYLTGIVSFRATGTVDVGSGTDITVNSLGFDGGSSLSVPQGEQGDSFSGVGSESQANNNGGGGGGNDGSGASDGGGGGGYGLYGSDGEKDGKGTGGSEYNTSTLEKLYLGSGGGGGGWEAGAPAGGVGGHGSGIIFIEADTITVSGNIRANGENGSAGGNAGNTGSGGGGGGSGGSILISGDTVTLGSALITSSAGTGGIGGTGSSDNGGAGGDGGEGRIRVKYKSSLSGTTSPTASTGQASYGTLYLGSTNTSAADIAEHYPSLENLSPGDVVIFDKENDLHIKKATKKYDGDVIGVISTDPGVILGEGDAKQYGDNTYPVALAGRIPVFISPSSEAITIGDYLTSSDTPGKATKATRGGYIIGRALENWEPNSGKSSVMTFAQLGFSPGPLNEDGEFDLSSIDIEAVISTSSALLTSNENASQSASLISDNIVSNLVENISYQIKSANGQVIEKVSAFSSTIIGNLKAGIINTQEIISSIGQFSNIFTDSIETDQLSVNMISPISEGDDIHIKLGANATASGRIIVENTSGSAVTTFDNKGNITTLGDLIAPNVITSSISAEIATFTNASISGELETTSARIEQLETKLAQIEKLDVQTAQIVNATVSGTLFADNINNFSSKVAAAIEEPTLLEKLLGTTSSNTIESIDNYFANHDNFVTEIDTTSATRINIEDLTLTQNDLVIDATAVYIDQYFDVNGSAYIAENLGIGQSLVISDSMFITAGSIDYAPVGITSPTLSIQPSGKGILSLMAGLFTLDGSGTAQINGDLTITGDLRVNNTLLTNMITANDFTSPLQVQLATISGQVLGEQTIRESRFEILNELGVAVATISAQGKAEFSSGIGIGSETLEATNSAQIESKMTSGTAVIKAGSSEIVIKSPIVTTKSLIYITPLGSTNNKVLYIKEITDDDTETPELESSFKVGFDTNTTGDVKFNWWIVN